MTNRTRSTTTHLSVSYRTLIRVLSGIAVLGVALAVVGLHAAYNRLAGDHNAQTVLTIAITVAVSSMVAVLGYGQVHARRARRTHQQVLDNGWDIDYLALMEPTRKPHADAARSVGEARRDLRRAMRRSEDTSR